MERKTLGRAAALVVIAAAAVLWIANDFGQRQAASNRGIAEHAAISRMDAQRSPRVDQPDATATAGKPGSDARNAAPTASRIPANPSSTRGPQLQRPPTMSPENVARVSGFASTWTDDNDRLRDFRTLASRQEPDPDWSPQMNVELANAITHHFRGLDELEVGGVRCVRSLCELTAVAKSVQVGPVSEWQRLMGLVIIEPWFSQHFVDASTRVGHDGPWTVYVTYFVRKPIG